MNIILILLSLIIGLLILLSTIVFLLSKFYFTKWRKVYDFVYEGMTYIDQENDYEEIGALRQILQEDFNLTLDQAEACLFNWTDKNWFKQQEFLK